MKKLKGKIAGFSLIEVVVTMGLLGGASLVVMQLTKESLRGSKKINEELSVTQFLQKIESTLSSSEACKNTFLGKNPLGEEGTVITELKDSKNNAFIQTGCTDDLAPCLFGQGQGALFIKEMRLHHFENSASPYNNGANQATLTIKMLKNSQVFKNFDTLSAEDRQKVMNQSFGNLLIERRFGLRFILNGTAIADCKDSIVMYKKSACSALGDGEYDEEDGFCKNVVLKHQGSPSALEADWKQNALTVDGKLKVTHDAQFDGNVTVNQGVLVNKGVQINHDPTVGFDLIFNGVNSSYFTKVNIPNAISLRSSDDPTTGTLILGSNNGANLTGKGGLVGIGTTNPEEKLHVNGDIKWGTRGLLTTDQGASIELGGSGNPYIDFSNDNDSANNFDGRITLVNNDLLEIQGANLQLQNGHGIFMDGKLVATEKWVNDTITSRLGDKAISKIIDHLIAGTNAATNTDVTTFKKNVCESIKYFDWVNGECIPFKGLKCASGKKLVGFNNDGTLNCIDDNTVFECPTGTVAYGVESDGDLLCKNPYFLFEENHTEAQCWASGTGSSVSLIGGNKYCIMERTTCPSGWIPGWYITSRNSPRDSWDQGGTHGGGNDKRCCKDDGLRNCHVPGVTPGTWNWASTGATSTCKYYPLAATDSGNNDDTSPGTDGDDSGCGNGDPPCTGTASAMFDAMDHVVWVACY